MKEHIYNFEKLEIWKLSIDLTIDVYKLCESMPSDEKFGMVSQIKRATTSISANIAEGMSREGKDRLRFIQVAFGSSIEVLNFLIIIQKLNFISEDHYLILRNKIQELTNKINSFYKFLKESK